MAGLVSRIGFLLFLGCSSAVALASGQKDVYSFRVLRDGADIGTHRVTVDRLGADAFVTVEIDLEVGIGPFVLYAYTHRNRELWRDGRLISLPAKPMTTAPPIRSRREATGHRWRSCPPAVPSRPRAQ